MNKNTQRITVLMSLSLLMVAVISGVIIGKNEVQAKGEGITPRSNVEVTVYNDDLALVKENRHLEIPAGINQVNFSEVPSRIDPTSVSFNALDSTIRLLEQNYEYDVVSDDKLLQKFLGEKIKITDTKGDLIEGYLIGTGENLIISQQSSGGEVKIIKSAQVKTIVFPELPGGLVIKPTLVWLLQNPGKTGSYPVKVSYLTGGLSWKADYVATINQNEDRVDLTGWVTLNNNSGAEYKEAKLKLVAGDVNRVKEEDERRVKTFMAGLQAEAAADGSGFKEESFFEYHLYTLNRNTTLKNNQMKQVELLSANSVSAKKLFIYEGAVNPKKVKVMTEFKNNIANNLGIPLPKGRIRVQKADQSGSLQFIGEDQIDHTPKDEKVRIYLGNAFDIVGERVMTNVKEPAKNIREETYRITLKNHKKENVTVTAVERMYTWDEWKITNNSHKYDKTEAGKAEFTVDVPAGGEQVITYTVRYKI